MSLTHYFDYIRVHHLTDSHMNWFLHFRFNPGIYGKKGAIYLKFLDKIQLRVRESGLFSKWQEDMTGAHKYKKHRRVNYENEVLPLTLEELSGSFYILIFGLSLSMLVYCFEITTFKFHSCKEENIRNKKPKIKCLLFK